MELDRNQMVVLSRRECFIQLGSRGFGRIGLNIDALPAILPVLYAVDDGDIYFHSGPGSKLTAAADNAIVAFEADGAEPATHLGWSVLLVGRAAIVSPSTDMARKGRLPLARWVGDPADDVLVRIRPDLVSGRRVDTRSRQRATTM